MLAKLFEPLIAKILAGLSLALLIALGIAWIGWNRAADARDRYRDDLRTAQAQIALLEVDASLKETATEERQADIAAAAEIEKELIDAIKDIPDSKPGPVRVAFGCQRLRAAGYPEADLPAVCRSGSGE